MKNKSIIKKNTGLQGKEKHNRMLELMNESTKNDYNSHLEFVHECSNGNVYAIVKEQSKYHIKKAKNDENLTVESFNYINGIKNKHDYQYPSYAKALKQLNLYVTSINESLGERIPFDSFKTKKVNFNENIKPKKLNLFEQYGCEAKDDFYQVVTETYLNGDFKKLHSIMEKTPTENKKEFFGYVMENFGEGVFDSISVYLKEDKKEADNFRNKSVPKKKEFSLDLTENEKTIDSMLKPKNKNKKGVYEAIYEDSNEIDDNFVTHGTYTISNLGGYEVMLSDDGDGAKVRDAFGSEDPETSDWLEIEHVEDEETGEFEPIIDPNGYNIPLNMVMRVNEATAEYEEAEKWLKDKASKFKKFFKTEESVNKFIDSILNEGSDKINNLKKKVKTSLKEDDDTKYKLKIDTPEPENNDIDIEKVDIDKSDKPFDDEPFDAGVDVDEDEDPKKFIQQLTGKIAQTLRTYTKDVGNPDFELEKFVINSIISATHTANMDSDDKKDIIKKINTSGEEKSEENDKELENNNSEEKNDDSEEKNDDSEEITDKSIEESKFNELIDSTLKRISEHHGMTYTNYLNFDNEEYVNNEIDKKEDKEMTKKVTRRKKPWYFSK